MVKVTISASVGEGGKNNPDDVKAVQGLLNTFIAIGKLPGSSTITLGEDAKKGSKTALAIREFQGLYLNFNPDGNVGPTGTTLEYLNADPVRIKRKLTTKQAEDLLDQYLQALKLPFIFKPFVIEALSRIVDRDRHVLAIWGYLRYSSLGRGSMYENWAWSQDEIDEYKVSAEKKQADKDIGKVKDSFNAAKKSEGLKLSGSARPRSLDEQIKLWNKNGSVKSSGEKLRKKLVKKMQDPEYANPPDLAGVLSLYTLLSDTWARGVVTEPTNATPGLSSHGQMHAIDFHVKDSSGNKVAQSGGPGNWRAKGLDTALADAVKAANGKIGRTAFNGPLKNPDEPWHYTYIPL